MAMLGANESKFNKPYLEMIASNIRGNKPIKFKDGTFTIDAKDSNMKALIVAIDKKNQSGVDRILKSGSKYVPVFVTTDGKIFTWSQIDKSPFSGIAKKSDGVTTAQQERASMYAIEMGLNKNGYRDKSMFLKDCYDGLKKRYPDMDGIWEEGFFQQQITVAREIPNNSNYSYSRDDGFMEDISKLVKEFGIMKKDTWNPADIWIVEKPKEQMKKLKACKSLGELNAELRTMFNNHMVVGISLKKLSGKTALWEVVNVDLSQFENKTSYVLGDVKCNLKQDGATDSIVFVKNGSNVVGKFQIRQNSAGMANLKVEGTAQGQGAARLGKVPLEMLKDLMKDYKINYNNDHNKFPKTGKDFITKQNKYVKMFNAIHGNTDTGIQKTDFVFNIVDMYNKKNDIAVSKLMQIEFLYEMYRLSKTKLNDFVTSMYFLAQKKGPQFGPFGKLY